MARVSGCSSIGSVTTLPACLPRDLRRLIGRLAAMLALISQIALGAMVLPDSRPADPLAALDALSVLCLTGRTAPAHKNPAHHAPLAVMCPLAAALALPALLAAAPTVPPAPPAVLTLRLALPPPARAPPARTVVAAWPRGPPALT